MENDVVKKTFVKKYWILIIILIVSCVFIGIYVDLNLTNGQVISKSIKTFVNNEEKIVQYNQFVYDYPFANLLAKFLYSLSISFTVALFILKVIQEDKEKIKEEETKEKEKEQKEENRQREESLFKNVFKGVFDRLVPTEIFDVIKSDILEAKVVRKNVQWIYDFKIEEGQLVLYRNVMYEIHNISSNPCNEPFSYIYSSTEYTETKILFLKWHENDDIKNTNVLYDIERDDINGNKMKELDITNKDIDFQQVKHDIEITPEKIVNINFKSRELFKNNINFIHETHFTTACSISWELEVNYPRGYSFGIIPMFTKELTPTVDDIDRKKYVYKGAILKGQGIEFTLTKKA